MVEFIRTATFSTGWIFRPGDCFVFLKGGGGCSRGRGKWGNLRIPTKRLGNFREH